MRKKLILLIVAVLLLCFSTNALADTDTAQNLIINGTFDELASTGLPHGWAFESWLSDGSSYGVSETSDNGEKVLHLTTIYEDDARFTQVVTVEPNSYYRIACDIKTENIVGGNGANISTVDSYSFSTPVVGTNDWQTIYYYGITKANQTSITVAVRIGGFGSTSLGDAWFDNVSVQKVDSLPDGETAADLFLPASINNDDDNNNKTVNNNGEDMPYLGFCVFFTLVALAVFVRIYLDYIRPKQSIEPPRMKPTTILIILLAIGFVVRVLANYLYPSTASSLSYGHSTDINCFMAWGQKVITEGPWKLYSDPNYFADYPPAYMNVLAILAGIRNLLGIEYGSATAALIFKLPSILCDLFLAFLVYKTAKQFKCTDKMSLFLSCFVLFNPIFVFISSVWGQIDVLLSTFMLIAIIYFMRGIDKQKDTHKIINIEMLLAGLFFGIAIAIKPQALMAGPIFAVAYICYVITNIKSGSFEKAITSTVLAVASAVAFIIITALPYIIGNGGISLLIEKYLGTATSYSYASIEAYNLMTILGGNWADVNTVVFANLTYKQIGVLLMVCVGIASAVMYVFSHKKEKGSLLLCIAFMFAGLFTLGHYMHERYLFPAVVLVLFAAIIIKDRRLYLSFFGFSTAMLFNALGAFIIVDNRYAQYSIGYKAFSIAGSIFTVIVFLYFAYTCVSLLMFNFKREAFVTDKTLPHIEKNNALSENKLILPTSRTDTKLHFARKDWIFLLALTILYSVFALTNLGTTQAPENAWEAGIADKPAEISFDGTVNISSIYIFAGITRDSDIAITDSDGNLVASYNITYDYMYRWQSIALKSGVGTITTDKLYVRVESGAANIKELAFFDAADNKLQAYSSEDKVGYQLVDEQNEIPKEFSYLNGMYFDELYHARTAYENLHRESTYEISHPPLGKVFISIGIAIFGMNAFGWRIVGTVVGILMVPLFYCLCKRLFKRSEFALLGAGLFAFDFMHFAQTRISTIDVYGVFFILLMFYFMYKYFVMNFYTDGVFRTLLPLGLAGVFFGLGAASKWICIYAGAGLAIMLAISFVQRFIEYRKVMANGTDEERVLVQKFWPNIIITVCFCLIAYIVVPIIIYSCSYLAFPEVVDAYKANGIKGFIDKVWYYQEYMYNYHSTLKATHTFQSSWYEWMFDLRPVWFYKGNVAAGYASTISTFGNPIVWWVSLAGAVELFVRLVERRIKATPGVIMALVGVASNLFPWMLVTRCTFAYHYFATVPFIIICAVYLLQCIEMQKPWLSYVKHWWLCTTFLLFMLFYPVISGLTIPVAYLNALRWLPRWAFLGYNGASIGTIVGVLFVVLICAAFYIKGSREKQRYDNERLQIWTKD